MRRIRFPASVRSSVGLSLCALAYRRSLTHTKTELSVNNSSSLHALLSSVIRRVRWPEQPHQAHQPVVMSLYKLRFHSSGSCYCYTKQRRSSQGRANHFSARGHSKKIEFYIATLYVDFRPTPCNRADCKRDIRGGGLDANDKFTC